MRQRCPSPLTLMKIAFHIATTLLLAGLFGSPAQSEVPPTLARWLLRTPGATMPLPEAEQDKELPPSLSQWAEKYSLRREPVREAENPQPLPPAADEPGELRFAAGAILAELPADWHVSQSDHLRHVRLYLTLEKLTSEEKFEEGLWISYHVLADEPRTESQLREFLQRRTADALPRDVRLGELKVKQFNGRLAIQQPYHLTSRPNISGDHLLIAANWGVVEVQTRFHDSENLKLIANLVDRLAIGAPRQSHAQSNLSEDPQQAVVGAWKAERARLLLRAGGTIELHHDRERLQQIEQANLVRPARRLRGKYSADGDILHVQWEDGSQLKLRFHVTKSELLLTDHLGRVSQLHRLFE